MANEDDKGRTYTPDELRANPGRWLEASSPFMDQLMRPSQAAIVGGDPADGPGRDPMPAKCRICAALVWLSQRDKPVMEANPGILIFCPQCFAKMEVTLYGGKDTHGN